MSFARFAAPVLLTLAVACGGADPSDSDSSTTEPTATSSAPKSAELTSTDSDDEIPGDAVVAPQDPPAADQPPPADVAAPVEAETGNRFVGVNLNGAEFAYTTFPGTEGRDYSWPTKAEVDYFTAKGMNTFRVGFLWERMQAKTFGELSPAYIAKLDELVAYATSHGANVILNPHNFARYYGNFVGTSKVPSSAFADLWKRLATRYAANKRVQFNLVNEPNGLPTEQWVTAANAAIKSIRSAGATNLIHVPGNAWTGAHSWNQSWYGTSNAKAMLDIVDPADNMVFEVHQYLDLTSGGKTGECVSKTIGTERLKGFIEWLRKNGKKGFVGEFAGGNNATCNAAVTDMLNTMESASDVLVGWLWWAAGPRWNPNYPFSIEPKDGKDAPQMALLAPYL